MSEEFPPSGMPIYLFDKIGNSCTPDSSIAKIFQEKSVTQKVYQKKHNLISKEFLTLFEKQFELFKNVLSSFGIQFQCLRALILHINKKYF